jgi:F-type H+-transporting ATPase subunit gamma
MAVSTKIIKRRIKSIANTRKITKAMELVAGAKMRKSVQMTVASRDYSASINALVQRVRGMVDPGSHPLFTGATKPKASLVIVAASDRGLCGGFNGQILKKTLEFLKTRTEKIRIVTVGRRAEQAVKRAGYEILASFEAISNAPSFERTVPVGTLSFTEFTSKHVDRVFLVSMEFRSAISQVPAVKQILPITPEAEIKDLKYNRNEIAEEAEDKAEETNILFEPSTDAVLDHLLPRLLEMQVYQALLETSASEHSARMMAMRNATENASEMLQDLSFTYNQARQASITREISEISAGKAAIE